MPDERNTRDDAARLADRIIAAFEDAGFALDDGWLERARGDAITILLGYIDARDAALRDARDLLQQWRDAYMRLSHLIPAVFNAPAPADPAVAWVQAECAMKGLLAHAHDCLSEASPRVTVMLTKMERRQIEGDLKKRDAAVAAAERARIVAWLRSLPGVPYDRSAEVIAQMIDRGDHAQPEPARREDGE